MKQGLKKIVFIHEGKEAYPEIDAYRAFFAGAYETQVVSPSEVAALPDLAQTICWFVMGFYPSRPKAGLVVHDYRSLSIGRLWWLKDRLKRWGNARPDLRLFQNSSMQSDLGFASDVPTAYLPMGVPPEILAFAEEPAAKAECDFCYIGVMSAERRTELMLDSFLKRFGGSKSFCLYGRPEPALVQRYKAHANIQFAGRLPQPELFARLRRARVAVNYFPLHHPHNRQTPTKLLEYAALGLRILCNEQNQSRAAAEAYGIACSWGPAEDMFRDVPDDLNWPANETLDASPFLWPGVIARSNIAALLEKAADEKGRQA